MDLEAIPGLTDELNSEILSMNVEMSGHQNVFEDENCSSNSHSTSIDLELNAEDHEEELIVSQYFDGSPCCNFGPDKSACWKGVGHERFLLARRESEDLEKTKLDLLVLSALRSTRTSASTSHKVVRASINYHFEGIKILVYAIGARRLKTV